MKMFAYPLVAAAALLAGFGHAAPASAQRGDQDAVFEARRMGKLLPLPELRRRVEAQMTGARYIGNVFDAEAAIYTFRFMREGSVIDVDVDGRSGRVMAKRGR